MPGRAYTLNLSSSSLQTGGMAPTAPVNSVVCMFSLAKQKTRLRLCVKRRLVKQTRGRVGGGLETTSRQRIDSVWASYESIHHTFHVEID